MTGVSPRERRLVALAILVAVVTSVWLVAVVPILNGFAARQEARDAAAQTLRENARAIAAYQDTRLKLADLHRAAPAWAFLAPSPPVATEQARVRVSRAVADSGGVLETLRDQPGRPGLVQLQGDARIDLIGLQSLLRHLEDDRPAGVVSALVVAAPDATTAQHASSLQVRFDVSFSYVPSR
jgi:type II secretory pathway component PulM